ncbi:alpha/beta hydrolase [Pararhodobacter marinus]|uniref:Alpha/beta hydrolase n=2 Tax=Pararhodobacter marinus TaxID=2184063 RepID=A0A2U2C3V0_9RHOB|nr:alpha/beta hydrolase fold domain-containing protein [Pararhodobacter marinus]PWE26566.1 alpha/beta hydrolase [Pararhodobacter marinus]
MSWQAQVIRALAHRVSRPALRRQRDPLAARARFERFARRSLRVPPGTLDLPGRAGGVPGLWVSNRPDDSGVIVYFHGGAYLMGSPRTHLPLAAELARRTGARVFMPEYRLAPEHPFPAAFEDAEAAYDGLLALGHSPESLVLAGDSAGGGLALALLARLCARGLRPAGYVGFSPWTDLTLSGASLVTNASRDQLLPGHRLTEIRAMILGGATPQDAMDPRLSPLHAEFPAPPPVLIHAAQTEILRDDALRMRGRLPRAEIRLAGDLPHVWPMLFNWLPEARDTLDDTARFIRRVLAPEAGS